MIIEYSKVIDIIDDKMILLASKQSACSKCGGCGLSDLEKISKHKTIKLTTDLIKNTKIGDQAVIAIDETKLLNLAFTTYIIPLIILIVTTIITANLNLNELIKAIIILAVTFISLILINYHNNQRLINKISFKVIRIISQ